MISEITVSGGGDGMVHQLLFFLVVGICVGLIYWVGRWFIGSIGAPPMASKIWDGLFILIGLIVAINFLLGLTGHPLFR